MEELLVALLQLLLEITFYILAELPFDWGSSFRRTVEPNAILMPSVMWLLLGAAIGGISLIIVTKTIIPLPSLRIANLVIAPIASAFISQALAQRRAKTNEFIIPRNHFWYAFSFTLGLALIRFTYLPRA